MGTDSVLVPEQRTPVASPHSAMALQTYPNPATVNCIKSAIFNVVSCMRQERRWASDARFRQEIPLGQESKILRTFKRLHVFLEDYDDVRDIDSSIYIREFLEVIRSESTSGTITGVALNSINKFLLYNFITLVRLASSCPPPPPRPSPRPGLPRRIWNCGAGRTRAGRQAPKVLLVQQHSSSPLYHHSRTIHTRPIWNHVCRLIRWLCVPRSPLFPPPFFLAARLSHPLSSFSSILPSRPRSMPRSLST